MTTDTTADGTAPSPGPVPDADREHGTSTPPHPGALTFRYLDEPAMIAAGVEDMARCIDVMEETFALLGAGDYVMTGANGHSHGAEIDFPDEPAVPGMPTNDGDDRRFLAMPAYLGGRFGTTGVKWYGSNVANRTQGLPRSIHTIVISDTDTGAPLAFMSGNLVSSMRTGAVAGLGARYLAADDAEVVGIIGPGVMARTALRAFCAARPSLRTVRVKGRGAESLQAFCAWARETFPQLTVEPVETAEEAVRGADIVTYTNTGGTGRDTYPLLERAWVEPGAFVSLPSATALDAGMENAEVRKVVDCRAMYEAWRDEVPRPWFDHLNLIGMRFEELVDSGHIAAEDLVELGDVVAGTARARTSPDQIVILSIGGLAVEDVAWATDIMRRAEELGLGQELALWDRPAMA